MTDTPQPDLSKATPRPWRVNKYGSVGAGERGTSPIVAFFEAFYGKEEDDGDLHANRALVVAAVNAYGQSTELEKRLAEALDRMVFYCPAKRDEWINDPAFEDFKGLHAEARAALAEARAKGALK